MKYNFIILGGEANLTQGQIEDYAPSAAALAVVRANSDVLDGCEGLLAPIVTVDRCLSGEFIARVDTHDEGNDIWVRLEVSE